jgi:hypothetical protein
LGDIRRKGFVIMVYTSDLSPSSRIAAMTRAWLPHSGG